MKNALRSMFLRRAPGIYSQFPLPVIDQALCIFQKRVKFSYIWLFPYRLSLDLVRLMYFTIVNTLSRS